MRAAKLSPVKVDRKGWAGLKQAEKLGDSCPFFEGPIPILSFDLWQRPWITLNHLRNA